MVADKQNSGVDSVPKVSGKSIPRGRRYVKAFTLQELRRLIDSILGMETKVNGVSESLWWRAVVFALIDTGATVKQLLAAKQSGFNASAGHLSIGGFLFPRFANGGPS